MARMNLRDDQWGLIAELLPGKEGDRGCNAAHNRLFVEAVLWMARAVAPWRDLPPEFGQALLPLAYQTDMVVVPLAEADPPAEPSAAGWSCIAVEARTAPHSRTRGPDRRSPS